MKFYTKILFLFVLIIAVAGCKKDITDETSTTFKTVDKYDFTVVHEWNELWMEMERHAAGYRPCPTANALGYVGLASYEACVTGMPEYAIHWRTRYSGA
jgi:hypothetical protein